MPPRRALPCCQSGSRARRWKTSAQRSTISRGRPGGPMSAVQPTMAFIPGTPASAALGTSGISGRRAGVTKRPRSAPALTCGITVGALLHAKWTWPASTAVVTSPPPLKWIPTAWSLVRPASVMKYCTAMFWLVPTPAVAKLSLPGFARMVFQVGCTADRRVAAHEADVGIELDQREHRELVPPVLQLRLERGEDGVRGDARDEQRVAVGRH